MTIRTSSNQDLDKKKLKKELKITFEEEEDLLNSIQQLEQQMLYLGGLNWSTDTQRKIKGLGPTLINPSAMNDIRSLQTPTKNLGKTISMYENDNFSSLSRRRTLKEALEDIIKIDLGLNHLESVLAQSIQNKGDDTQIQVQEALKDEDIQKKGRLAEEIRGLTVEEFLEQLVRNIEHLDSGLSDVASKIAQILEEHYSRDAKQLEEEAKNNAQQWTENNLG